MQVEGYAGWREAGGPHTFPPSRTLMTGMAHSSGPDTSPLPPCPPPSCVQESPHTVPTRMLMTGKAHSGPAATANASSGRSSGGQRASSTERTASGRPSGTALRHHGNKAHLIFSPLPDPAKPKEAVAATAQ